MNIESLSALLIFLPIFMAIAGFAPNLTFLRSVVAGMTAVLALGSIILFIKGPFAFEPVSDMVSWHSIFSFADFILLGIMFIIGIRYRHKLISILVLAQILPLILIKFSTQKPHFFEASIAADHLSLMMVMIVCIVGSFIVLYATEYMQKHALKMGTSPLRTGMFLFFLILFLGAMNGLLLSNNLLWMFFFWELTTLCSFFLIAHDRTDLATTNALRALWMNLTGGVLFIWAIYLLHISGLPLEIHQLTKLGPLPVLLLPAALLCLAAFTKSAQLPFQSWLTGAMVAPAPVSALLHSSTMVNAGVFLILKLSPIYQGTPLASYLAILGALTFIYTSAIALTQNNAKKILAYSTIGSLGLVIACAGIGTPQAYSAAMLLILFHAVAKALLFMGVGHIEQLIKSKNIEDMWGLMERFPKASVLLIFGMISMFLPPFGALISKWMAVHAAAQLPMVVIMLALGSALTVVYWTRWAGMLVNSFNPLTGEQRFKSPLFIDIPLTVMAVLSLALSLLIIPVYWCLSVPMLNIVFPEFADASKSGALMENIGAFMVYPAFLAIGFTLLIMKKRRAEKSMPPVSTPYYSGLNRKDHSSPGFTDPLGNFIPFCSENYYLKKYLPQERVNAGINAVAIGFIILLTVASL
ncbi:MAG: NADH-quinone oxidoreductase subunit L [Desulfonatronovibrio sp. MSAO_Bac4]|nr:MAG: NADH-quinone oxidoreductase subunit L [Desulfonatronovibrio sp. MSAO_Bac4]